MQKSEPTALEFALARAIIEKCDDAGMLFFSVTACTEDGNGDCAEAVATGAVEDNGDGTFWCSIHSCEAMAWDADGNDLPDPMVDTAAVERLLAA